MADDNNPSIPRELPSESLRVLEDLLREYDPADGDCRVQVTEEEDGATAVTVVPSCSSTPSSSSAAAAAVAKRHSWLAVLLGLAVSCLSTPSGAVGVFVDGEGIDSSSSRFRVMWGLHSPDERNNEQRKAALAALLLPGPTTTTAAQALEWLARRINEKEDRDTADTAPTTLHLGWETNETSERLANLMQEVAHAAGARVVMHGEVTPPCLHYCVVSTVTRVTDEMAASLATPEPQPLPITRQAQQPTPDGYFDRLARAYACLLATATTSLQSHDETATAMRPDNSLLVDCAGSGPTYLAVRHLVVALQQARCHRRIVGTNRPRPPDDDTQNGYGADHVCSTGAPPLWYNRPPIGRTHCASLNAGADAVVFHSERRTVPTATSATQEEEKDGDTTVFSLLQGHAMAGLVCEFVASAWEQLRQALLLHDDSEELPRLRLGLIVVQTGATDAASVIRQRTAVPATLHVETVVSPIQLMAAALDTISSCDVVVAWSPTGYGSLLFGPGYLNRLSQARRHIAGRQATSAGVATAALERLEVLPDLMHPCPGLSDALSTLLLVDAILHLTQQTVAEAMRRYDEEYTTSV
jgi:hypothetical protein